MLTRIRNIGVALLIAGSVAGGMAAAAPSASAQCGVECAGYLTGYNYATWNWISCNWRSDC